MARRQQQQPQDSLIVTRRRRQAHFGGGPLSLDLEERLAHLASLPNGWFEGEGQAIPTPLLQLTRRLLQRSAAVDLPYPSKIAPTLDGEIHLEWDEVGVLVTAEGLNVWLPQESEGLKDLESFLQLLEEHVH